jgi:hypothetical protein
LCGYLPLSSMIEMEPPEWKDYLLKGDSDALIVRSTISDISISTRSTISI